MTDPRDRLTRAWELRRDVHAFLTANIGSTLAEIFAAFPGVHRETMRQVVKKLCKDLDAVVVKRRGNVGSYSAASREIRPLEETRANLRESGRRNVKIAHAGFMAARRGKRAAQPAPEHAKHVKTETPRYRGPQIDPERPWRTTHECGDTEPSRDSRGQGAVRQKVSVNCYQLF